MGGHKVAQNRSTQPISESYTEYRALIEDAQSFLRGKPVNKAKREERGMMGSWKRVRKVG